MKFLVVVFDGLRPDQLEERVTPNLCALARAGLVLSDHTATFPSETRVSSAALATGSHISGHGIIANRFLVNGKSIDGSSLPALLGLGGEAGGVMSAVAIGEVLAKHGRTMLSIGSQSEGSWGLSSWGSWQAGAPAYWVHDHASFGKNPAIHRIASAFPDLPRQERPALTTVGRVVDGFLSYVASEPLPDLGLLWFSEPDISYHLYGLAHPSAREVLSTVDREFGRVVEWWEAQGKRERVQLVAASDHGHAIIGDTVSVAGHLRRAGFKVGRGFSEGIDIVVEAQRAVNLWVRNGDPGLLEELHHCLSAEPWFGVAFSRTLEGNTPLVAQTLPHSAVMAEHPRSPDLSFVLGNCVPTKPGGEADAVFYDGNYPVGAGMHGGLTRHELSALGILAGDWFRTGTLTIPTGIVDLAPTILTGLGLPIPPTVQGRLLTEAILAAERDHPYKVEDASISVENSLMRATVRRDRYQGRLYLKGTDIVWHPNQ